MEAYWMKFGVLNDFSSDWGNLSSETNYCAEGVLVEQCSMQNFDHFSQKINERCY